jgi:hypothetical protein
VQSQLDQAEQEENSQPSAQLETEVQQLQQVQQQQIQQAAQQAAEKQAQFKQADGTNQQGTYQQGPVLGLPNSPAIHINERV